MTIPMIFGTMMLTGLMCSMGCGTVTTPYILGSLLGGGYDVQQSRQALLVFSFGKIAALAVLGLLASLFGTFILTQIESLYPSFTIWLVRGLTLFLGIQLIYTTLLSEFFKKKETLAHVSGEVSSCASSCSSSCSSASSCGKMSSKIKVPKSFFLTGALYALIPCGPLIANITYASTMSPFVAILFFALFGVVNSIIPVVFLATLVGMANSEFLKNSQSMLKYIKIIGGIILVLAAIYKV